MPNRLKISGLILLIFMTYRCGHKAFPDERFTFSSKYRNLINPYHIGDTLHFDGKNGRVFRIKITGIDSIISNSKGGFMSSRPNKDIKVYCDNLDYHRTNAKDTILVFINNYPDSLEQSCSFAVRNFRGDIDDRKDSLISELQTEPGNTFQNCYVVKNIALDLGEEPLDIEFIYVQQTTGIIAFKTYNGDLWLKR